MNYRDEPLSSHSQLGPKQVAFWEGWGMHGKPRVSSTIGPFIMNECHSWIEWEALPPDFDSTVKVAVSRERWRSLPQSSQDVLASCPFHSTECAIWHEKLGGSSQIFFSFLLESVPSAPDWVLRLPKAMLILKGVPTVSCWLSQTSSKTIIWKDIHISFPVFPFLLPARSSIWSILPHLSKWKTHSGSIHNYKVAPVSSAGVWLVKNGLSSRQPFL